MTALDPAAVATCLPSVAGLDWSAVAGLSPVFVGAGAVNGPLAENLAYLGMRHCLVVDPKRFKPQSTVSQCDPADVGAFKAVVLADRLRALGVDATAVVDDVYDLAPGWVGPDGLVIAAVDNRRADIGANRLAAAMRARLVRANVEPLFLQLSVRCYDLRDAKSACAECAMTAAQYAGQRHPAGCDGDGGRPTGSPRALTRAAAGAAALAVAQFVGSPGRWADRWAGRQWDLSLLGGQATTSVLPPNPACRWDHGRRWPDPVWLGAGPEATTLGDLLVGGAARVRVSGRVATYARCGGCGWQGEAFRWLVRPDAPAGTCECGEALTAVPFFTTSELPARDLDAHLARPLADWGVPPRAVFAVGPGDGPEQAFVVGPGRAEGAP